MGNKKGHALLRAVKIIGMLLVTAAFLFGALLLVLGLTEQHRISQAAAQYTKAEVQVTETRFSDRSKNLLVVVLEPTAEVDLGTAEHDPHTRQRLGRTVATTGNRSLAVGDVLTMYYDPANTDTRIVDFGTSQPMLMYGGLLSGGTFLIGAVLLTAHIVRKRRRRQPATMIRK